MTGKENRIAVRLVSLLSNVGRQNNGRPRRTVIKKAKQKEKRTEVNG